MIKKSRNNQFIEVVRGILNILVVFCHFSLTNDRVSLSVVGAARCAVPFFIILSGFYAYREDKNLCIASTKKKMCDMLRLIFKVAVLYTVVNTVVCAINSEPLFGWFTEKYMSGEALRNFLVFNRARFFCSIAYYLFMMIYVFAVYMLVVKLNVLRYAFFAVPVLLIVNLVMSEIMHLEWFYVGNWMLTGIPFFFLGVFFSYKKIKLKRSHCVALSVAGFVLTEIEANIANYSDVFVYVGTILLSSGLFLLCQSCEDVKPPKILVNFGSNYGTGIFMYHCAAGYILTALFEKAGLPVNSLFPFIVIIFTVLMVFTFTHNAKFNHSKTK